MSFGGWTCSLGIRFPFNEAIGVFLSGIYDVCLVLFKSDSVLGAKDIYGILCLEIFWINYLLKPACIEDVAGDLAILNLYFPCYFSSFVCVTLKSIQA